MNVLLALTFVYGVIKLLTLTKLFNKYLVGIIESAIPYGNKHWLAQLFAWFDNLFFYFSLVFQAWYWLFR